MLKLAIAIVALVAPAIAAAQPHPAARIAAAERTFAADGLALGVKRSFLKWAQPDAIMISDRPRTVTEVFAETPDPKAGERGTLVWWPLWTGIARSGDLGFSTGPVESGGQRRGHYFTVWKKQADGGWKWIYDGGANVPGAGEPAATTPESYLTVATGASTSPAEALAQVRAAETDLAKGAAVDQRMAHLAALADDGRLYVAPLPPAKGAADFRRTLEGWPVTLTLGAPLGGEASAAGDLAFTYGRADWVRDGAPGAGHYVHVWQKRPEGWKLAFAQIVPAPPPARR